MLYKEHVLTAISSNNIALDTVKLCFIHSSYLNEKNDSDLCPKINSDVLYYYRAIGIKIFELLLAEFVYIRCDVLNRGEFNQYMAKVKGNIYHWLEESFQMSDVLMAKGAYNDILNHRAINKIYLQVFYQTIGALYLYTGYKQTSEIIESFGNKLFIKAILTQEHDNKSILQEFTQKYYNCRPVYSLEKVEGPPHDQTFTVMILVGEYVKIYAKGKSKKKAEQDGAGILIENYFSNGKLEFKRKSRSQISTKKQHKLPRRHCDLQDFINLYSLGSVKKEYLSIALTHASYKNEHRQENSSDNALLACLGSFVIQAISIEHITFAALEGDIDLTESALVNFVGHVINNVNLSNIFDFLGLKQYFLTGKGQSDELTNSIKSDAIQSLMAAVFISCSNINNLLEITPDFFKKKLYKIAEYVCKNEGVNKEDTKSKLQRYTQVLNIQNIYSTQLFGPEHGAFFNSKLLLKSSDQNKCLKYTSQASTSKKRAEKNAAGKALRDLSVLNDKFKSIDAEYNEVLLFYLRQIVARLNDKGFLKALDKILIFEILGSDFLKEYKVSKFIDGSIRFFSLLEQYKIKLNKNNWAKAFETIICYNIRRKILLIVHKTLTTVRDKLIEYKIDSWQTNVVNSLWFRELVDVLNIIKSVNYEYSLTDFRSIFDDFALFHKQIEIFSLVQEDLYKIYQPDGFLLVVLDEIIKNLKARGVNSGYKMTIRQGDSDEIIYILLEHDLIENNEDIKNNIFLNFASEVFPISTINFDTSCVKICLKSHRCFKKYPEVLHVLKSYYKNLNIICNDLHTIWSVIHDLKNLIIALNSIQIDDNNSTKKYKDMLEASYLKDSALSLCSLSMDLTNQPLVIEEEPINIYVFIYEVIQNNLKSPSIRLHYPQMDGPLILNLYKPAFISMIDNIIKNSVDAIKSIGNIVVDWIYDVESKILILEFNDDGPGIPEDIFKDITQDKIIKSNKKNGTGVGIISVKNAIKNLNGKFKLETSTSGTRWTIEIPATTIN